MTAIAILSRAANLRSSRISRIGTPSARFLPDFAGERVEQRGNLKAFLLESRIVGQREAEVAGAEDGDLQPAVESENLPQVLLEILDVVTDAADPELAEVREVFANLRRVQMELMRERLRRDGFHAVRVQAC